MKMNGSVPRAALTAIAACLMGGTVADSDYQESWGPDIGSDLPQLVVRDTDGKDRSLEDLSDSAGTLILVARSSDW